MVLTAEGLVAIESIAVGDMVIATDPDTGETTEKEVVETYVNETEELIHVWVDGEEIITTQTHPFYVPEKGWTSAVELKAGDQLQLVNGEYVVIEAVEHELLEEPVKVYNFQVEDFHTYYVGENNSVLVHNSCSTENRIYKPNDGKHKGTARGKISADPFWNDLDAGQKLLDTAYSSSKNKQLYNVYDGKLVKFQPDNAGTWHAYEVRNPDKEVPADVLRAMLDDGVITQSQYNKFRKGK